MKGDCPYCKNIQPIPSTHGLNACVLNLQAKLRRIKGVYWRVEGVPDKLSRYFAWMYAKRLGVKPIRVLVLRKA